MIIPHYHIEEADRFSLLREKAIERFNLVIRQLAQLAHLLIREKFLIKDEHTLEELARLGHPYAVRHPQAIHRPPWLVHTQSGELASAFKIQDEEYFYSGIRIKVGFDFADSPPWVVWVLFGTQKMVPRDFLALGFQRIRPELDRILKTALVLPSFGPLIYLSSTQGLVSGK